MTHTEHQHASTEQRRTEVQRELGLTGDADPELDAFAARLAQEAGVPFAMVNVFTPDRQQFVGLHAPDGPDAAPVGRTMPLHHGFCRAVVDRARPLVLPDVFAAPRFAGDPVIDLLGIRTYAGAPLIHDGVVLGTVCAVGPDEKPQETGQDSLALVNRIRDEVMAHLYRRAGHQQPHTP
ncbi:GAF domain-containing protein [Actinacidiphila glaucinigra]|uniref:GAF domain-containing protein n=1 Tax=Actinacidiphila glaucinigra TaxID=235986 RepID=A0A239LT35_9ACTN|nr:GAF domain-containing protein [Actinacidiphila glaucinigra]SNT33430.1 GAF domain-containing protein [Actinacidiphila glaucinigra]